MRVTRKARSGRRAVRLDRKRRSYRLRSGRIPVGGRTLDLAAGGYVRGAARGQRVKFTIIEMRNGRRVGYRTVIFRSTGFRWQALPKLAYSTSGRSDTRVSLRVSSRRRGLVVDDLRLLG